MPPGMSSGSGGRGGGGRGGEGEVDEGPVYSVSYQTFTLPFLRYTNVLRAVVIVNGILSIVLWLCGGDTDYFEHNITHFTFTHSVFDIAAVAVVKAVALIVISAILEEAAYKLIDSPYDRVIERQAVWLHVAIRLLPFCSLVFSVVKGAMVLYSLIHDADYQAMSATYNAVCVSFVVLTALELGLGLWSGRAMRRLQVVRVRHQFNEQGQELKADGRVIRKSPGILKLFSLAKEETHLLLGGMGAMLVSSGSQIVAPLFFGKVVDSALKSMEELNRTVLILLGIYICGALASMARAWLFVLAGQRMVARLRKTLFGSVIRQDIAFFDVNRTGELCNRLASDTQVLQNAVTVNISMLSRYMLQIIGSVVFMFILNASLTGILLAVVPIVSFTAVRYGKFVQKKRKEFQDRLADAGTQAEEALSSVRTVRMFSGEPKVKELYGAEIDRSYRVGSALALAQGAFDGLIGTLAYGSVSLVLWYGGKLVNEGDLSAGVLTSFLLYTLQVAIAFGLLSSLYGDFMQAVGASIRIFNLLERLPGLPSDSGLVLDDLSGAVEFRHVRFTYPSRPDSEILKGVSFKVEPGEMVALVGPSGGGKSTIVSLIERFYDPDSGIVYLGGHDLKALDAQWFRRKIAMVSQEPTLFAFSIRENIAYGCQASDEEVMEAAKQANAHEFISQFEEGYDTLVGERGVRLSGGQKQRIAIARALIMNPRLLLLDEATSALDAESEHLVKEAIDRAMKGRTVIVIAHRLSTVRNASKVVVIDQGTIAEMGTHDHLIEKNGVYKRLVLRQLTAGSMAGASVSGDGNKQSAIDFENKQLAIDFEHIALTESMGNSSVQPQSHRNSVDV
ncbi:uncharacterized protein LOC143274764 [Babylonia areolata]|uniref:uncharacterized protein LOC143274764 n=1 Tax=Babylonia areolata TaxID=304850 RepID=UPI003FD5160F